jgi:hypothetical protein
MLFRRGEKIRKVRAETQKLKSFTPEEVDTIFGKKIETQISLAVDEKLNQLVNDEFQTGFLLRRLGPIALSVFLRS